MLISALRNLVYKIPKHRVRSTIEREDDGFTLASSTFSSIFGTFALRFSTSWILAAKSYEIYDQQAKNDETKPRTCSFVAT